MSGKGFIDSLFDSMMLWAAVQDSKDFNGKPDPYKAAGIAYGLKGNLNSAGMAELGTYLGAEGAFDDYHITENAVPEKQRMECRTLSEAEKQRRTLNAQHTKAQHRYWDALWEYKEFIMHVAPVELAAIVWEEVLKKNDGEHADPELREKFTAWLRRKHDIRMDSEGKMHNITKMEKLEG